MFGFRVELRQQGCVVILMGCQGVSCRAIMTGRGFGGMRLYNLVRTTARE